MKNSNRFKFTALVAFAFLPLFCEARPSFTNDDFGDLDIDPITEAEIAAFERVPLFTMAPIGMYNEPSRGAQYFWKAFASQEPRTVFLRLLKSGTNEAKAYGLVGLYLLDDPVLKKFRRQYDQDRSLVRWQSGFIKVEWDFDIITDRLDAGTYNHLRKKLRALEEARLLRQGLVRRF